MNLVTECLNNIKIIKIYGWTECFLDKISEYRKNELQQLGRRFKIGVFIVSNLYLFPQLL